MTLNLDSNRTTRAVDAIILHEMPGSAPVPIETPQPNDPIPESTPSELPTPGTQSSPANPHRQGIDYSECPATLPNWGGIHRLAAPHLLAAGCRLRMGLTHKHYLQRVSPQPSDQRNYFPWGKLCPLKRNRRTRLSHKVGVDP